MYRPLKERAMDNIIIALVIMTANIILGITHGLDWVTVVGVGTGAILLGYGLHQVLANKLSGGEK